MAIYFYSTKDQYGAFSNFSRHPFELDGLIWPTSEHYFQAQKFEDDEYRERIRSTPSPMIAARLGRSRKVPIRSDWEERKDEFMYRAVLAKFQAHSDLKQLLLSTGQEEIIEKTTRDYYWGCGANGTGKNMLGRILMQVREELRS
ncbi:MAG: NADAR family protein [Anaerolineales bacterium]|nr:MAG: NADAR family protein [Chloroflexota bacterium]MBE7433643.1 NADAR family protein [Anaerolineales bacterium]MCK6581675.1 NADAR family protein [Anaerolineales bacterium]GJQ34682.1 MAG: N-glycosidase YbiA [Anaerolineaceae bacterium]